MLKRIQKLASPSHIAGLVIFFALALALPAILFPLGLAPEGDAIDYRIPILRWILRHHSYPNFTWTVVEDYPFLGELLMLPFFGLSPGLARLVPIAAYFSCALAGGLFLRALVGERLKDWRGRDLVWIGTAVVLCLRPLAIQSNLLMTDNLGSAFALLALWGVLEGGVWRAGIFWALAMATKYMIWPASPAIALAWALRWGWNRNSIKNIFLIGSISALGALPFLARNFLVNGGNPFYPLFGPYFGQNTAGFLTMIQYGRGTGLQSLLFLPWDLLVTNDFVKNLYDYTLGKLFYLQLGFLALAFFAPRFLKPHTRVQRTETERLVHRALVGFALAQTLCWFFSSQQLRFLVPALVVANILIFAQILLRLRYRAVALLVLAGMLSILSIQKDSLKIVFFGTPSVFAEARARAETCLAPVPPTSLVGHAGRNSILGFFDHDFIFTESHGFRVVLEGSTVPEPDYIYDHAGLEHPGFEKIDTSGCLWRKISR